MAPNNSKMKQLKGQKGGKKTVLNAANTKPKQGAFRDGLYHVPNVLSLELQQLVLNAFKSTFVDQFDDVLSNTVQDVKQHLFNREFAQAFSKQAFLDAYVIRWSPSRALAYLDVFENLPGFSAQLQTYTEAWQHPEFDTTGCSERSSVMALPASHNSRCSLRSGNRAGILKIVSLGGGAGAELAALAGLLSRFNHLARADASTNSENQSTEKCLDITLVDIADWSSAIARLQNGLSDSLNLSAKDSCGDVISTQSIRNHIDLGVKFMQKDLLSMQVDQLEPLLKDCIFVTLMFTLNELYSTSMSATTKLLLSLTDLMQRGSLLLVVDSPGSYSTVDVGKSIKAHATTTTQQAPLTHKKYPMIWLLDHTLLDSARKGNGKPGDGEKQWEKVEESDSKWFRLPSTLKYPIELENMRYQMHLYRRT